MTMAYSNSPLITSVVDLKTKSNPRKNKNYNPTGDISKITIHHMAGRMTAKACAEMHAREDRKASANYYIGFDGDICLGVPEERRAWTSSSPTNDYLAITIEVSNDCNGEPWTVSEKSFKALIALCTDICVRNGIESIKFTSNKDGNLTMHRYFSKTACPGDYLASKFPEIAERINASLSANGPVDNAAVYYTVKKGDTVYRICVRHNISIAEIKELNPQFETRPGGVSRIYVGERLRVH